jgi:plasmid maintenance system antidote protein VapI
VNEFIDIKLLKSNPEQFKGKVTLVQWPEGKACKHPSDFFKRNYLNRVVTMPNEEVSERLGVTAKFLSSFLNEEVAVDPSFAVKLGETIGFCEETWLGLQRRYNAYLVALAKQVL